MGGGAGGLGRGGEAGAVAGLGEGGDRVGGGVVEAEDGIEAGDAEAFADDGGGGGHGEGAGQGQEAVEGGDEAADAGGVDLVEGGEIEDEMAGAGIDEAGDERLEGSALGAHHEFAIEADEDHAGAQVFSVNLQHVEIPAYLRHADQGEAGVARRRAMASKARVRQAR